MKVTINHFAYGQELAIGSVSKEIWDYIQDKYEGDVARYMDDLCENGKIPEEFMLADNMCSMYDNDDLFHATAGALSEGRIEVDNDKGEMIYECDCRNLENFEKSGIMLDITNKIIDPSVRYISVFSSVEKGLFLTGTFELEGEFDPKKLVIFGTVVEYNGENTDVLVMGFEYAGKKIECDFDCTDGKSLDVDIIDTKADEE